MKRRRNPDSLRSNPEKNREYKRDWIRRWRRKSPEEAKEKKKKWQDKNIEHLRKHWREYNRKRLQKLRTAILEILGNKCERCGFEDYRALQIDHIHGGGTKESKSFNHGHSYYVYILKKLKKGSKDYQCLCANCNWIKRVDRKETGHSWGGK